MSPSRQPEQTSRVVFEYNPETQAASFRAEGNFPLAQLVNILEVAKNHFVMTQIQQMTQGRARQQAQRSVCLPDGSFPR